MAERYEYEVQGRYFNKWETISVEESFSEAMRMKEDYDNNEDNRHRIRIRLIRTERR